MSCCDAGWLCMPLVVILAAGCTSTPISPSSAAAPISSASLPHLALPVPQPLAVSPATVLGATRFVAFGDSITYGVLSSFDGMVLYDGSPGSYPARLELGLHRYHAPQRFLVLNRGVPAEDVSRGGVQRIQSVLTSDRPQALLLLEGINDLAGEVPLDQIAATVQRIVDLAVGQGAPVLLATMYQTYPVVGTNGEYRSNAADLVPVFNDRIRAIARRQNVYLVDLYAVFADNRALIGGDGLHPTEDGYDRMAAAFLTAIQQAFPVRGSFQ